MKLIKIKIFTEDLHFSGKNNGAFTAIELDWGDKYNEFKKALEIQ